MGISIRAYARQRGVSDTAVRKAIKAGRINTEADGTIDPVKTDVAWNGNTNPAHRNAQPTKPTDSGLVAPVQKSQSVVADPAPNPGSIPSYQTSRAIKAAYDAKMARIDYETRINKLLNADDVAKEALDLAKRIRDRLMSLPHHLAAILASETDSTTIESLLECEIRGALEDLSN